VYRDSGAYPNSAQNMKQTTLQSDMVVRRQLPSYEMATMAGTPSAGYTLAFTIAV